MLFECNSSLVCAGTDNKLLACTNTVTSEPLVIIENTARDKASVDTSSEILASITTWHSWKARCTEALDGSQVHPSSILASILKHSTHA